MRVRRRDRCQRVSLRALLSSHRPPGAGLCRRVADFLLTLVGVLITAGLGRHRLRWTTSRTFWLLPRRCQLAAVQHHHVGGRGWCWSTLPGLDPNPGERERPMTDPTQLGADHIRVLLDHGEVVELDGGTLTVDGEVAGTVLLR